MSEESLQRTLACKEENCDEEGILGSSKRQYEQADDDDRGNRKSRPDGQSTPDNRGYHGGRQDAPRISPGEHLQAHPVATIADPANDPRPDPKPPMCRLP